MTRGADPIERGFDAVLFDLDGTLIDSAPLWRASYRRLAATRGQELAEGWWESVAGRTMIASTAVFDPGARVAAQACTTGRPDTTGQPPATGAPQPELVEPLVAFAVEEVTRQGVATLPGALPLAREIVAAGIPFGIVTSAWRVFAQAVLDRLELPVDVLVTGDDPLPGKPDPAPYVVACAQLGVAPSRTITIEDSPTGVAAARAAGTAVLAVPHAGPIRARPDVWVLPSLEDSTLDRLATWRRS